MSEKSVALIVRELTPSTPVSLSVGSSISHPTDTYLKNAGSCHQEGCLTVAKRAHTHIHTHKGIASS